MGIEQLDYIAFVADLEAKRDALNASIASLRAAISMGALGKVADMPPASGGMMLNTGMPSISGGEVPAGAFHGKSIPEAAKLYLEIVKKKQTSKEIADALRKGGMESTSKSFPNMVHSVLDRARKANTGIVKLDRSHWGLTEWYPASLRASVSQEKRAGKKKARKGKGRKVPTEAAQAPLALQPGKANERAMELLQSNPASEHSLADVAKHVGMGEKGARLMLGKLLKAKKIAMSAPGFYKMGSPHLVSAAS